MNGVFIVKEKDLEKVRVLELLTTRQITQEQAAPLLEIGDRQVRNIFKRYKEFGPEGVISQKTGKPSNRKFPEELKDRILTIITIKYSDFKPTLATEKLQENHNIKVSVEFVRQLMIAHGLWIASQASPPVIHPLRPRRGFLGELVHGDGSHHAWFEERENPCVLIVLIDDATSSLLALYFSPTETLEAYFKALEIVLKEHGRAMALYTDRFSVFEVPRKNPLLEERPLTQFGRALRELDIELILAKTPQAKGRVERVNRTLQDRMVKKLRLKEISDIASANAWLGTGEYIKQHNEKFAVPPNKKGTVFRPLTESQSENIRRILSPNHIRIVQKDLSFQYEREIYQICLEDEDRTDLRGQQIIVWRDSTYRIKAEFKGKKLAIYSMKEKEWFSRRPTQEELLSTWKTRKRYIPSADHPHKRTYKRKSKNNGSSDKRVPVHRGKLLSQKKAINY